MSPAECDEARLAALLRLVTEHEATIAELRRDLAAATTPTLWGPPVRRGNGLGRAWRASAPSRFYHRLDGAAVAIGARLELLVAPGVWLPGRYAWTGRIDDPPTLIAALPPSPEEGPQDGLEVRIELPSAAFLRWAVNP